MVKIAVIRRTGATEPVKVTFAAMADTRYSIGSIINLLTGIGLVSPFSLLCSFDSL